MRKGLYHGIGFRGSTNPKLYAEFCKQSPLLSSDPDGLLTPEQLRNTVLDGLMLSHLKNSV